MAHPQHCEYPQQNEVTALCHGDGANVPSSWAFEITMKKLNNSDNIDKTL
jgi:hypothetical protein